MSDWRELSKGAAFASHRLIGWIYWHPNGIEAYTNLGIPNGFGYYVTTRAGKLGYAGADAVIAAYYSIHPNFIRTSYELLSEHAGVEDAIRIRDEAVLDGLTHFVPEINEDLATMGDVLWDAADSLPLSGRPMFAAQLRHRRSDEPLLNAWLAVNCIREWRGDTHWAIHMADGLSGTEAGILDGAWRNYGDDWLARSRGADDGALSMGYHALEQRGFARDGVVTQEGVTHRQELENKLNDLTALAWKHLGEQRTIKFIEMVGLAGDTLINRIDQTAGEKWMPAARPHPKMNR